MKIIISEVFNKFELIRVFRKSNPNLTFVEIFNNLSRLPYILSDLNKYTALDMVYEIKNYANVITEEEPIDVEEPEHNFGFSFYNCNINHPQEYIDAMAWYDNLSEQEKKYVNQIVLWRSRPAVC